MTKGVTMDGLSKAEIDEVIQELDEKIKEYRKRTPESYKEKWSNRWHEIYNSDQEYASGLVAAETKLLEKLENKKNKKMVKV
jgi:glutamyl-tRNA reductase